MGSEMCIRDRINAVRKACSGWAKEWERAVWNALEGVDLHKEEAGR